MKRHKIFLIAVTCYIVTTALLWIYLITTSLIFSYEHFIGNLPAGAIWIFAIIGTVFAWQVFRRKMKRVEHIANQLILFSNKDLLSYALIWIVGLFIASALIWGWLELYPTF